MFYAHKFRLAISVPITFMSRINLDDATALLRIDTHEGFQIYKLIPLAFFKS